MTYFAQIQNQGLLLPASAGLRGAKFSYSLTVRDYITEVRVRVLGVLAVLILISSMEVITEGVNALNLGADSQKKNRIQVSNTKKPLFFYVNLSKRYMQQYGEVELSALGMAIATVVTVAEILKNNGLAIEKKIMTSTVDIKDDLRGRPVQKAKIEILLAKTANFDELMAAAAVENNVEEHEN